MLRICRGLVVGTVAAFAGLGLIAAPALAAVPVVTTGGNGSVTYQSAVLFGTVNPHGASTEIYFQYGTTNKYGLQSTPVEEPAGARATRRIDRRLRPRSGHRLPLPDRRVQRGRHRARRRQDRVDGQDPAVARHHRRPQPDRVRQPGDDRRHAVWHRQRRRRGSAAGEPVPLHRGVRERRQPRADAGQRLVRLRRARGGGKHPVPRRLRQRRVDRRPSLRRPQRHPSHARHRHPQAPDGPLQRDDRAGRALGTDRVRATGSTRAGRSSAARSRRSPSRTAW